MNLRQKTRFWDIFQKWPNFAIEAIFTIENFKLPKRLEGVNRNCSKNYRRYTSMILNYVQKNENFRSTRSKLKIREKTAIKWAWYPNGGGRGPNFVKNFF